MKNALLSISFLFIFSSLFSQDYRMGSFQVTKVNFSIGSDQDMLRGMNYNYFADQIPLDEEFQLRDYRFGKEDISNGYCENHNIAIGFTLKHDKFQNWEWRNTLAAMEERGDGVTYQTTERQIMFSSTQDEYALESVLLYAKQLPKGFKLYAGVGTNMGVSVNNEICVEGHGFFAKSTLGSDGTSETEFQSIDACYAAGNMFNQRLLTEFGLAWTFRDKYEIGLNFRNGIGYRAGGGTLTGTKLESSNFSFAYYLNN